ncbi:conserved hypothetical protein [Gammaproteobacteria bacterium]
MTLKEQDLAFLSAATSGNAEAMDFLEVWREYVHRIDDLVDEGCEPEALLATFAMAIELYSHPFYLKNLVALRQIARNVTNGYADVVKWEGSKVKWQAEWADHYRHIGQEMVLAVASITGGWAGMRHVSETLRTVGWIEHHDKDGRPV